MTLTLQARINGGAVQTGGIRTGVVVGDDCQLTALSKAGWRSARWEIYCYPPDFACPSGWTTDSEGVYYVTGSADPSAFELTHWGKYLTRLVVDAEVDERTTIDIPSPSGLRDFMRREGSQFGGNRLQWIADQQNNLRAMEAAVVVATPVVATYSPLVTLSGNTRSVYDGENGGVLVVDVDLSEAFWPGAAVEIFAPAGSATSVLLSEIVDPDGSLAALFDVAEDFTVFLTATTTDSFVASAHSAPPLALPAAPTIVSAVVAGADLDKLIVTWSSPVVILDIVGLSLGGTMATPRTITAVESGNGTAEVTFDLSGDLSISDTATLVVGATRVARAFGGGTLVTAETEAITFFNVEYDWTAVAAAKVWLRARSGIGVADGAALSAGWTDAIGGYVWTEATDRPVYRATGINGHPSVDFDGTNDKLQTATALSTILGSPGDFSILAAVKINSIGSTSDVIAAEAVVSDTANAMGLHLWTDSGTPKLLATTYEVGVTLKKANALLGSLPRVVIVEHRVVGGELIASVNGVDGTPTACGAPWTYSGNLRLGADSGGAGTNFADIEIAEIVVCNVGTKQTAGIAAMMAYYGAT